MRFMSADFVRGLNKLTYWVGLACLLFYTIADVSYNYQVAGKTFLVVFIGTLVCVAAGYVFAFLLRLGAASIGTFVQGPAVRISLMWDCP